MCHSHKGEDNFSNNPTFLDFTGSSRNLFTTSSNSYRESPTAIKNVASSSYHGHESHFRKVTYISKVGIYDENDNLIMTAELARPYKKEEDRDYTFKLKYDLI
jgi:hypothetical protein